MVICLEWGADSLHMVQLMPLLPKTSSSLASFKSRLVIPFWYWLTQVVLEKMPLNGCSSSSSSLLSYITLLCIFCNSLSFVMDYSWSKKPLIMVILIDTQCRWLITGFWWVFICLLNCIIDKALIFMRKNKLNCHRETSEFYCQIFVIYLPSVLWRCWLGGRASSL